MPIALIGEPCSRCGAKGQELYAYRLSEVVYRGRRIEAPWLCERCIEILKKQAWRAILDTKAGAPAVQKHPGA